MSSPAPNTNRNPAPGSRFDQETALIRSRHSERRILMTTLMKARIFGGGSGRALSWPLVAAETLVATR